jgi:adenylate kinase
MKILITGTPGAGKTTTAKALAKKLGYKYLNEHDFCRQKKIGKTDKKTKELVVPIPALQKQLCKLMKKEKNIVIEGHLLCETRLDADTIIVLSCNKKELEKRLRAKKYSEEKVFDNLFCETEQYCLTLAKKNFPEKKLIAVDNSKGIKKSLPLIIKQLKDLQ